MINLFKSIKKNQDGSMATIMAFVLTLLMGSLGVAVDLTFYNDQKSKLQSAVDAAALASALELGLTSTKEEEIQAVAEQYFAANFDGNGKISGVEEGSVTLLATPGVNEVTVALSYGWKPFFAHILYDTVTPIEVSATAALAGNQNVCIIALDNSRTKSLNMRGISSVTANNCGVYANSVDEEAISLVRGASLSSSVTFTAGGYAGEDIRYNPIPVTDSPAIVDPLRDRPHPSVGRCYKEDYSIDRGVTLEPGVYCGGLHVIDADVNLNPGNYIIKDGPLILSGEATLTGDNVGFFLTGDGAVFEFGEETKISISAPKDTEMAGILFFEDRTSRAGRSFVMQSKDAQNFEGTVYLPKGHLIVDKASRIGRRSAWTAIVAKTIEIGRGPTLVLNSDYGNSTIPAPEGIAPENPGPRLVSK